MERKIDETMFNNKVYLTESSLEQVIESAARRVVEEGFLKDRFKKRSDDSERQNRIYRYLLSKLEKTGAENIRGCRVNGKDGCCFELPADRAVTVAKELKKDGIRVIIKSQEDSHTPVRELFASFEPYINMDESRNRQTTYQMTEAVLLLTVLESVSKYLEADSRLLSEAHSLSENAVADGLGNLRDDVKEVIRQLKNDPEAYDRLVNDAKKNSYRGIVNLIKKALNKGGFSVVRTKMGTPYIMSNSSIDREKTLAEIRRRITAMQPRLAVGFKESNGSLFKEAVIDGKNGYTCSAIGELADVLENMNTTGQLNVKQTGENRYGTPDSPLIHKHYFISLPDSNSQTGREQ